MKLCRSVGRSFILLNEALAGRCGWGCVFLLLGGRWGRASFSSRSTPVAPCQCNAHPPKIAILRPHGTRESLVAMAPYFTLNPICRALKIREPPPSAPPDLEGLLARTFPLQCLQNSQPLDRQVAGPWVIQTERNQKNMGPATQTFDSNQSTFPSLIASLRVSNSCPILAHPSPSLSHRQLTTSHMLLAAQTKNLSKKLKLT